MVRVQIDGPYDRWVVPEELTRAAEAALTRNEAASGDLTVVLTDDPRVQALNRQYLDRDHTTDVLAFPAGTADPDTGRVYLGDVVISCPQAARQAAEEGHAVRQELMILVVHGVLHLLGFDDRDPDECARMWKVQEEILDGVGKSE